MSVVNLRFFFLCSLFKVFFFATCSAFCALSLLFRKIFLCRSSNLCGGLCFNEVIFFIPPASFFFSSFIHCCRLFCFSFEGGRCRFNFLCKKSKKSLCPILAANACCGSFPGQKMPIWGGLLGHLVEQVPSNFLLRHKLHRKTCVLRRRLWKRSFCGVPVFNKQWARCNLWSFFFSLQKAKFWPFWMLQRLFSGGGGSNKSSYKGQEGIFSCFGMELAVWLVFCESITSPKN